MGRDKGGMQGKHMLSRTLDSLRKALSPFMTIPTVFYTKVLLSSSRTYSGADIYPPSAEYFICISYTQDTFI